MLPHVGTILKQKLLQVEEKKHKQTNKERKKQRKQVFHVDDVRGRSFSVLTKFTQIQMVSAASQSFGCSLSPTLTSVAVGYT